jgi:hypothetical protein
MKLVIRYLAQVKRAAGRAGDEMEVARPCPAGDVVARLAGTEPALRPLLLDAGGRPQRALLLFLGDEQITSDQVVPRDDGDVLTILTPMAGGGGG